MRRYAYICTCRRGRYFWLVRSAQRAKDPARCVACDRIAYPADVPSRPIKRTTP